MSGEFRSARNADSVATANQLELIGFWTLVAGLIGEIAILFVPHRPRLHNSLTVICVVAIIAGVWLERVGAEENRAPRKLRQVQREQIIRAAQTIGTESFVVATEIGAEPLDFGLDIAATLKSAGWEWRPYPRGQTLAVDPIDGRPTVGFTIVDHIEVQAHGTEMIEPARKLVAAFREARLDDVRLVIAPESSANEGSGLLVVIVGGKK